MLTTIATLALLGGLVAPSASAPETHAGIARRPILARGA
jgi:hypothetical protein